MLGKWKKENLRQETRIRKNGKKIGKKKWGKQNEKGISNEELLERGPKEVELWECRQELKQKNYKVIKKPCCENLVEEYPFKPCY